ncbi:MAG: Kelch repeat-containing protein [Planctomycetaceae bacterium]
MCSIRMATLVAAAWLVSPNSAHAHFLWVVTRSGDGPPRAEVYFSESASPDDPELLGRVLKAECWALGGRRGDDPKRLTLQKKADALVTEFDSEMRSSPVVVRHTYGTLTRGGETFLLNYYAKTYPLALPGTWRTVKNSAILPLEIVPVLQDSGLTLRVLWNERPQAKVTVTIEGPGIEKKIEGATDDGGEFSCRLAESGLYSIRARYNEDVAGEHEGAAYKSVRHYSTLALRFLPPQMERSAHNWPALARGVTSFGGAVDGNWLYVYGGHYGRAHQYSRDEQSGDFLRLNLREPQAWEPLPGGPKLTGLTLVEHRGQLYRVGGFTAKNGADEDESLWSQAGFARFNPQTPRWVDLPSLPEGRSSHDAAVVNGRLYVVGGWNMQGKDETRWHDTAWAFDLSADGGEWKPLPAPRFHRRALALAEWQQRLYCVGGMQEQGGPTTAVAVFDPATNEWSEGPALLGTGMDGFGASAFASSGALYATTMSGSVLRLTERGRDFEFVGQLQNPRFFHRLLPWRESGLVVVGGAGMSTGKILSLELLGVSPPAAVRPAER